MDMKVCNTWNKNQVPQEKPYTSNTHSHYTHTTTISVQVFGAFDIEKYHLRLKSQLFRFIMGFMYSIASVVLRPYKWLDTLGVMYKTSIEWSLSFCDFAFQFFNSFQQFSLLCTK